MDIQFHETMSGTYRSLSPAFPGGIFSFTIDVQCDGVTDPRVITGAITGVADMEGVAKKAPLTGMIEVSPLWKRTIVYEFNFTLADGKVYRFAGHKSTSIFSPLKGMTFLPGTIYDETGAAVATAETSFNALKDMLPFLASWRFRKSGAAKAATA